MITHVTPAPRPPAARESRRWDAPPPVRGVFAALTAGLLLAGCARTVAGDAVPAAATITITQTVTESAAEPPTETTIATATDTTAPAIRTDSLTPPDPCALLTRDEADQLAGRPLQEPVSSGPEGEPTMCQFTSDPNEPSVAQVTVQVGDGVKKYLDIDKDTLGHEFTQPTGIGEEAWQEENAIFVRVGIQWFGITLVLLNDPAENVEPLKAAATIAAGRVQP